MDLKKEVLSALRANVEYDVLLSIVRRYKVSGATSDEAYEALAEISKDLGCDKDEGDDPVCEELEYLMQKVWYGWP